MNDTVKPKLVILNDFFYPAYKAGGPIQSLVNLIVLLENDYEIYVVTAARDLNEITPMQVKLNQWSELLLPSSKEKINIWYSDNNKIKKILNGIIVDINPSAVYLNGMYSFSYVILPILYLKNIKIVICPRGMIQQGALSGKYLKKVTFLTLLKSTGLLKNVWWHATSKIEQHDIKRIFGKKSNIILAGNVPKALFKNIIPCEKRKNELRLVYI